MSREEAPDSERRYVENAVQGLIQWMPLGSSGSLLLSFLLGQEWLQAILTFPVIVVTAVWAGYSQSFVARLRAIYTERGAQDADSLVKGMDRLNQALIWQVSGFEQKYLRCQANACRDFVLEGQRTNDGIFTPMLTEVFVPLELDSDLIQGLRPGFRKRQTVSEELRERREGLSIWKLLRRAGKIPTYRHIALLAHGGYGKTTLLRNLTFRYAEQLRQVRRKHKVPFLIPFLLLLRKWAKVMAQPDAPTLSQLLANRYIPDLPDGDRLRLTPDWVDNLLFRGDGLVMFDGFDEVAEDQRQAVSYWLHNQMMRYPRSVFILTSRPAGYDHYQAERLSTTLRVRPFTDEQRNRFVNQWYLCQEQYSRGGRDTPEVREVAKDASHQLIAQINRRPALADMAQNPLMLNMIAAFHRFYPTGNLPRQRTELYQEICQLQLQDRPMAKGIKMLLPGGASQQVLQGIALEMVQRNTTILQLREIISLAKRHLSNVTDELIEPAEFINQIVKVAELIVEREPGEYEFAHLSFQNFLAAVEINRLNRMDLLLANWDKAWWKETILLYASQLRNITGLIQAACNMGPVAIPLAYECWKENPRHVPTEIVERLQGMRLKELDRDLCLKNIDRLLSRHDWKAADKATFELMKQIMGGQITVRGLRTFPYGDLKELNGLWVKHSKGQFGFSVQKEIYLKCGGVLDGQYREDAWNRFCATNGWNKISEKYASQQYRYIAKKNVRRGLFPGAWRIRFSGPVPAIGVQYVSLLSHPNL